MISGEKAAWLLDLISGYFRDHDEEWFATNIGDFQITITMGEGAKIRRKGSLDQDFEIGDDDLNSIIRETLGVDDLFLFKGHSGQRYIYLSVKFPESDQEYGLREPEFIDVGIGFRVNLYRKQDVDPNQQAYYTSQETNQEPYNASHC